MNDQRMGDHTNGCQCVNCKESDKQRDEIVATIIKQKPILNGDHLEFELEHANTPHEQRPEPSPVECPTCEGSGRTQLGLSDCPACEGTGGTKFTQTSPRELPTIYASIRDDGRIEGTYQNSHDRNEAINGHRMLYPGHEFAAVDYHPPSRSGETRE